MNSVEGGGEGKKKKKPREGGKILVRERRFASKINDRSEK